MLDGAHETDHRLELVPEDGPWPRELSAAGFHVETLSAGRRRQLHRGTATVFRLARIFRARQPDLILNWAAKTQLYGAPAAVLAGMSERVLWWQQGIPTGDWIDRCATALPARAIGCYSAAAARAQARLSPSRPTFVVSAGASVAGARSERAVAEQPALQLPCGMPVVGLVGRLQPWKGQDRLLEAHALLRERGHRLHTLIVGGDTYGLSPGYAASLAPLVSRLGLTDAVTMTGQVPDAGPYIERMDVLVNASDPEPLGSSCWRMAGRGARGRLGGPAEFIEHGRTGFATSGEPRVLAFSLMPGPPLPTLRPTLGPSAAEGRTRV